MNAPSLTGVESRPRTAMRDSAPVLGAAAVGLLALGLLFHAEVAAAVRVWIDSTAYSHCFFVLPIAAWLAWDRRAASIGLRPAPTPWPALAVPPLALAWFAAERLGIMEGRQFAALGMAEALAVGLLGWRMARVYAAPLAYLVFLVPFGAFITPNLQAFTAGFVDMGLDLLDIPHVVDALTIEIPAGLFYIAEACAGLRFLIAAIAYGALYACLTYRSPGKRVLFLVASTVVPVIANGLRALGIVVAGHMIGNAEAAAADHVIYGWGFFSVIILLLTLAGLPFREDTRPLPPPGPRPRIAAPRLAPALFAAGLVAALAAVAPLTAAALNQPGETPRLDLPGFVATPECTALGDPPGPVQHFQCGELPLTATLRVLPARATPAMLRAARAEATHEQSAEDAITSTLLLDGVPRTSWRVVELHEPGIVTATAAWVRGQPDPGGLTTRLWLAMDSVTGQGRAPVLVAASLRPGPLLHSEERDAARQMLRHFLRAQGPLLAALTGAAE